MKNKIFQLISNLIWSFKFYLRVGKHIIKEKYAIKELLSWK